MGQNNGLEQLIRKYLENKSVELEAQIFKLVLPILVKGIKEQLRIKETNVRYDDIFSQVQLLAYERLQSYKPDKFKNSEKITYEGFIKDIYAQAYNKVMTAYAPNSKRTVALHKKITDFKNDFETIFGR